jgi:exodeoxyribonuclease-3
MGDFMVKAVCWNVNSINSRLERALALLERHKPDILCLQELKCTEDKFPFAAFEQAGYHSYIFGQKTYNGVALLSRKPLTDVRLGFGDGVQDEDSRLISGRLDGVSYICGYIPNGKSVGHDRYYYKLNWLARLSRHLAEHYRRDDNLVVVGDFNIAPDDRDVHDPGLWREQILCSSREREMLAEVKSFGLEDCFRVRYPDKVEFSWWDYRNLGFQKNIGLRIDLILATAPMVGQLKDIFIDRDERKGEKPSDHAPVVADFS